MDYFWKNKHQEVSYSWKGFMKLFAHKPKWKNPKSDMPVRTHVDRDIVVIESEPIDWPDEYDGGMLRTSIRQTVWDGSVGGGKPVQLVDPSKLRRFTVKNRWGGTLVRDGKEVGELSSNQSWEIDVPEPVRLKEDGWAIEGYPNAANQGDRHWYGVEEDGTTHEAIWVTVSEHYKIAGLEAFKPDRPNAMADYCRYSPEGHLLDGVLDRGSGRAGVVKGNIPWLSVAWQAGDNPHILGTVWDELALVGHNGASSDGQRSDWEHPAYWRHYRISKDLYDRLKMGAKKPDEVAFIDSLYFYGFVPYDRRGVDPSSNDPLEGGFAIVAGNQHVGRGLEDFNISISDIELVTKTSMT